MPRLRIPVMHARAAVDTMEPRRTAMLMLMELQIFFVLGSLDRHLKIVLDDLSQTSVRFRWRESVGRRIVGFNVFSPKLNCMESLPMVLLTSQESVARAVITGIRPYARYQGAQALPNSHTTLLHLDL